MIKLYKYISGKYDPRCSLKINFRSSTNTACETQCNIYELAPVFYKYNLRKYYFTNSVVPIWNGLPNSVAYADSTNLFKSRLPVNKDYRASWFKQVLETYDFVYDYKAAAI